MNTVQLIGNIATEITLSQTKSEKNVAHFVIAINDYNETDFIPVTVWNNVALNLHQYCHKGSKIAIVGKLKQDSYMEGEKKRSRIYVVARTIEFLTPKEKEIVDDEWGIEEEDEEIDTNS